MSIARNSNWRVEPNPSAAFESVVVLGHIGPEIVATPGESYTFEAWLPETGESTGGQWPDSRVRRRRLLEYASRAGQYATYSPMGGGLAFAETHDGDVPGGSLLIAVRPPTGSECGRGGWYLIDAIEDQTTQPNTLNRVDIDMTFVASLDKYETHADVHGALGRPGIGIY